MNQNNYQKEIIINANK